MEPPPGKSSDPSSAPPTTGSGASSSGASAGPARTPDGPGNGSVEVGYGSAILRIGGQNIACIIVNLAIIGVILFFYHEVTVWHNKVDVTLHSLQQSIEANTAQIVLN